MYSLIHILCDVIPLRGYSECNEKEKHLMNNAGRVSIHSVELIDNRWRKAENQQRTRMRKVKKKRSQIHRQKHTQNLSWNSLN